MKKIILPLLFVPVIFHAQQTFHHDPEITNYVSQVSTDSLKSHINSLVSFGTRHTMSSTTDPKRGIGAARRWVLKSSMIMRKMQAEEWKFFYKIKLSSRMERELIGLRI